MKTKNITIIENVGYYHPSNTNWSYHIHIIIDSTGARYYKETFGGVYRIKATMEKLGRKVEVLSGGVNGDLSGKGREVANLFDIESYNGTNWGEKSFESLSEKNTQFEKISVLQIKK